MSEDTVRLHQPSAEVSREALARAEEMIEREEGVHNRLVGWLAALVATVAVVMSLFHLYTAYYIVRPEHLRATHVAFVLFLTFLIFPIARPLPPPRDVVGLAAGRGRRRHRGLPDRGRRRFLRPLDPAERLGHRLRRAAGRAGAGGDAPHHRLDPAGRHRLLPRLRVLRPLPAGAVDAQGLRGAAPRRSHVHDARGHLRHRDQRLLDAHHPVHDLRRVPAVLGRGQVLHRFLVRGDGRQADRRRAHRDARLVPARRPFRLGRGDDRDARRGGRADAGQGRLQQGGGGRAARRRRAGRDHLAAGARRGGVHHRRVPQDLVPRRGADGGHPDLPVLPDAVPHGRDRRAQVRHEAT